MCWSAAAAVAILHLQQQHPFESIQNVKLPLCCVESLLNYFPNYSFFCLLPASCLDKVLPLQQQFCSYSSSTLQNKFRLSNYPYVLSLVIKDELLHELFNLFHMSGKRATAAEAIIRVQQHYCSTLLNKFRTSNYSRIPSLVIIDEVLFQRYV